MKANPPPRAPPAICALSLFLPPPRVTAPAGPGDSQAPSATPARRPPGDSRDARTCIDLP
jgi:hypothetical protein